MKQNIKVGDLVRWRCTLLDIWYGGALVLEIQQNNFYVQKYSDLLLCYRGDTYLISSLDCEVMSA